MSSSLLRDWDEASKGRRKKLLEWFRDRFARAQYTGELLETECGADVSLFLARVLVWMHKTVGVSQHDHQQRRQPAKKCFALSEQLACVQIFLTSANVHVYYREFQQADGLPLLIRVLGIQEPQAAVSDADRQVVVELLLRISQRGRAYKEEISRCDGEIAIIRGALAAQERCGGNDGDPMAPAPLWDACRDLLLEQMVGNPSSLAQVHSALLFMLQRHENKALQVFGAQILRHLITPGSFYVDMTYRRAKEYELVPLAVGILQSSDVQLQHEGLELVHSLLQNEHLQSMICKALMEWVKNAAVSSESVEERFGSVQFSREHETFSHMRSQFVHAAQSVSTLMNSTPAILPIMLQQFEILVPLAFALVVERARSLKWHAAAIAIHYIFTNSRTAAAAHLSQIFSVSKAKLLTWKQPLDDEPESLAMALLQSDEHQRLLALQFFQNGWRKPVSSQQQQQQELKCQDGEEDVDSELSALAAEIDTTMRDFVSELQVPSHHDPTSDERDLYCDAMDQQREQQMRATLQRHFAQFRGGISAPLSPSPAQS